MNQPNSSNHDWNNLELVNTEFLCTTAMEVIKKAWDLLMSHINNTSVRKDDLSNLSIREDKESELLILSLLKKEFPTHGFLWEEFGEVNSSSPYKWIIDPIDGTNNYTGGRDSFSIAIWLEHNKEVILWLVLLPKRNELFYAIKWQGAYLNGQRIQVSEENSLDKAVVTYSTYPWEEEKTQILDKKVFSAIPNVKYFWFLKEDSVDETFGRWSMAAEFCYLACGRIDGVIR